MKLYAKFVVSSLIVISLGQDLLCDTAKQTYLRKNETSKSSNTGFDKKKLMIICAVILCVGVLSVAWFKLSLSYLSRYSFLDEDLCIKYSQTKPFYYVDASGQVHSEKIILDRSLNVSEDCIGGGRSGNWARVGSNILYCDASGAFKILYHSKEVALEDYEILKVEMEKLR